MSTGITRRMEKYPLGRIVKAATINKFILLLLYCELVFGAGRKSKNGAVVIPPLKLQKIQVESIPRNYEAGPIDGSFALSIYDQIVLTVERSTPETIWQWAMFTGDGTGDKYCELSKIYGLGEQAAFFCGRIEGVYWAYAKAKIVTSLSNDSKEALEKYRRPDLDGNQHDLCDDGKPCLDPFYFIPKNKLSTKTPLQHIKNASNSIIKSDPIKLKSSEYCFQWGYTLDIVKTVGYAYTDVSPHGADGTYILYSMRLYVAAANSMAENELFRTDAPKRFSGLLTKRFYAKGLEPCFRQAHQAIELISSPSYQRGQNFWVVEFKVHTDTIVSVLSDISFTVTSRQHMALYGCFIAEIPEVLRRFVDTKVDEVYGRQVEYVGRHWELESANHRRDAQAFVNACITREFGITVRGVAYIIQNWFKKDEDIQQMAVPDVVDLKLIDRKGTNYEHVPVKVNDMVWTPTHLVFLTAKSHIILHPSSVVYKGFGLIRETQSYRIGGLVNRRWCARTGTPKEHNMIIPGFSMNGNFVVLQILSTEETTTMWLQTPPTSCLGTEMIKKVPSNVGGGAKSSKKSANSHLSETERIDKTKKEKSDQILTDKLERCIHRKEVPTSDTNIEEISAVESDALESECKTLLRDSEEKVEEKGTEEQLDAMLTFWFSGQALITENDPHFIKLDDHATLKQVNPNSESYNSHILYEVDVTGQRLLRVLRANGLPVTEIHAKFGTKNLFWVHDIQFTAVERSYIEAVEFKTSAISGVDFSMAVLNVVTLNQPIRIFPKEGVSIERLAAEFTFPGVVVIRPTNPLKPKIPDPKKLGRKKQDATNTVTSNNKLQGRIKIFTTNTAKSSYVLHLDYGEGNEARDFIFYATFDGGHARPLSYYDAYNKSSNGSEWKPNVVFTGVHEGVQDEKAKVLKADMVMTEHGMISVLWRKVSQCKVMEVYWHANANSSDIPGTPEDRDHYPQAAIIGSVLVNEPLIKVMPFKGSSYMFQRITADDQIAYGEYDLKEWHTEKEEVFRLNQTLLDADKEIETDVTQDPESGGGSDGVSRRKREASSSLPNLPVLINRINQNPTSNLNPEKPYNTPQVPLQETLPSRTPRLATAKPEETSENTFTAKTKATVRNKAITPPQVVTKTTQSSMKPITTDSATTTPEPTLTSIVTTTVTSHATTLFETPVTTPIESSVTSPRESHVTSPLESPVTTPIESPATTPVKSPATTPATSFVATPATSSVATPVKSSVTTSAAASASTAVNVSEPSVVPNGNTTAKPAIKTTVKSSKKPSAELTVKPTIKTTTSSKNATSKPSDHHHGSIGLPEPEKNFTFARPPVFAYPKHNLKLLYVKNTRMLSIPYESLLAGNIDAAADPSKPKEQESFATDEICPYTDFVVHFLPFDFAEVEYRTRISAEIVYLGNGIPLEADILAEFDDVPGVSVELSTATEENRDQTLVRKIIDIRTYLTTERMEAMYKYPSEHDDDDKILEDIRVFSITLRPSILNLHCPKNSLFKTLQINVGCNPFSRMRFIGEAAGLTKVPYVASTDDKDREASWTLVKEGDDYVVTIPWSKVNFEQRKLFDCVKGSRGKGGYCIVPKQYTELFQDNIYSFHFTKKIVPKFEQFLTRHVRRVTGNIFLYNILGTPVKANTTMLDSGCHNFGPLCAPSDESCLAENNSTTTAKDLSWAAAFLQEAPSRSFHADVYRYFRNCFEYQRKNEDGDTFWLKPGLPDRMSSESYWIFNSTNYNAFSLDKHRNMVFLIRATVLNTPGNSFTFCQRLETFFLLYMTGVAPARLPLPWMTYLLLTVFVLMCLLLLYVFYRHSPYWKSEDFSRRLREEEYRERREAEVIARFNMGANNPENYGIWAARLRNMTLVKPEGNKKSN